MNYEEARWIACYSSFTIVQEQVLNKGTNKCPGFLYPYFGNVSYNTST